MVVMMLVLLIVVAMMIMVAMVITSPNVSCLCTLLVQVIRCSSFGVLQVEAPRAGGNLGWRVFHGFPGAGVKFYKFSNHVCIVTLFFLTRMQAVLPCAFLGDHYHCFFRDPFNISATDVLLSIATGYARTPWQFLCIEDLHGWQGWETGEALGFVHPNANSTLPMK